MENLLPHLRIFFLHLLASWLFSSVALAQSSPTEPLIVEGQARIGDNQQAQKKVESVHKTTESLISEFENKLKVVDGLKVYNTLLARQLTNQQTNITTLKASIANAAVIERQIVPLLLRMLDGLQHFISLDVPFLQEERALRVARLQALLERADLSVAEKSRRVFEAFQIENDYGRTLEAYKGKLNLENKSFDVDYLRIGRVALLYRSLGNDRFGYWDNSARNWVPVSKSQHRRNIDKGLKVARQEMAPELITVPVPPPVEVAP